MFRIFTLTQRQQHYLSINRKFTRNSFPFHHKFIKIFLLERLKLLLYSHLMCFLSFLIKNPLNVFLIETKELYLSLIKIFNAFLS